MWAIERNYVCYMPMASQRNCFAVAKKPRDDVDEALWLGVNNAGWMCDIASARVRGFSVLEGHRNS